MLIQGKALVLCPRQGTLCYVKALEVTPWGEQHLCEATKYAAYTIWSSIFIDFFEKCE